MVDEDGEAPKHGADKGISPPQLPPLTPRGNGSVLPPLTEDIIAFVSHGEDPRHLASATSPPASCSITRWVGATDTKHKTQNTKQTALSVTNDYEGFL